MDDSKDKLLAATVAAIGSHGLDTTSLRQIAAAAGGTTALIFKHFKGREELIAAAIDYGLVAEAHFHATLRQDVAELGLDPAAMAEVIAFYVRRRSQNPAARFWLEILFNAKRVPNSRRVLAQWYRGRRDFWRQLLPSPDHPEIVSRIVASYTILEESYAFALNASARYDILMRETARAIFRTDAPRGPSARKAIAASLGTEPVTPEPTDKAESGRDNLLRHGFEEIIEHGIAALNQRRLAQRAGTSQSMIAYHFRDMAGFMNEALSHGLLRDIYLTADPSQGRDGHKVSMTDWVRSRTGLMQPSTSTSQAGYYTNFARVTGEACLIARSDETLVPLVQYLRELEGWGTFQASRSVQPPRNDIVREDTSIFALWMKSEALLTEAGAAISPIDEDLLLLGADWLMRAESISAGLVD